MAKHSSTEQERLIKLKHLAAHNINPHAAMLVFEAYVKNSHPLPIKYVWEPPKKDKIQDGKASSRAVEIYVGTAGYLGKRWGNPKKCDELALKLLAISYYRDVRPMPVHFQMANAVEFIIRTPGGKGKNPLRNFIKPV